MKYATLGRMGAEASRVAFGMRQLDDPADIERHAENVGPILPKRILPLNQPLSLSSESHSLDRKSVV